VGQGLREKTIQHSECPFWIECDSLLGMAALTKPLSFSMSSSTAISLIEMFGSTTTCAKVRLAVPLS